MLPSLHFLLLSAMWFAKEYLCSVWLSCPSSVPFHPLALDHLAALWEERVRLVRKPCCCECSATATALVRYHNVITNVLWGELGPFQPDPVWLVLKENTWIWKFLLTRFHFLLLSLQWYWFPYKFIYDIVLWPWGKEGVSGSTLCLLFMLTGMFGWVASICWSSSESIKL